MTWKSPIKAIDIEYLPDLWTSDLLDEYGTIWLNTLLLKKYKKVIAVCSLELLERSGVVMCAYEEFTYGLIVQKIRRPKLFEKYMGRSVAVGEVIKELKSMDWF